MWRSGHLPTTLDAALHAEYGQTGQVRGGGQQVEIGADFHGAAHPRSPSAVPASHQVAELALDLRTRRPVVGSPLRIGLASTRTRARTASFTPTRTFRARALMSCTPLSADSWHMLRRTSRDARVVFQSSDLHRGPGRAGHRGRSRGRSWNRSLANSPFFTNRWLGLPAWSRYSASERGED